MFFVVRYRKIPMRLFIIVFLVILSIPLVLNAILQLKVSSIMPIIEGTDGGPATWLQFWGSYLAAIASFVMAFIAYKQGVDNQLENKRLREAELKKQEYDAIKHEYEFLENRVLENIKLYTVRHFTYILELCANQKLEEAKAMQLKLFQELNFTSVYTVRFWIPDAKSNNLLNNYNSLIAKFNKFYTGCAIEIKECLHVGDVATLEMIKTLSVICDKIDCFHETVPDLTQAGFNALKSQKERLHAAMESYRRLLFS